MRIHRILTALAMVALMCAPAKAQDDDLRHEIAISYGVEPNSFWIDVGGIFTTNISSEDVYSNDKLMIHRNKSFFSLMPAVKFNWLRKDQWGLYSKLAAGVFFGRFADKDYDENGKRASKANVESDWGFNWQASVIGIEAGSDNVRGFIELGVGEQGVALAGVRCKF